MITNGGGGILTVIESETILKSTNLYNLSLEQAQKNVRARQCSRNTRREYPSSYWNIVHEIEKLSPDQTLSSFGNLCNHPKWLSNEQESKLASLPLRHSIYKYTFNFSNILLFS